MAQNAQPEFCSSGTSEAYHSPNCGWGFVVHDPHRVEDVSIPHKPAYHTYSRWALNGHTYVFGYRDIDQQPEDMAVDIYLATDGSGLQLIGSTRIPGLLTDVSTARLTFGILPDVVFYLQSGELTWLEVVRITDQQAKEVFWYGASQIDISVEPTPTIVAKSRLANRIEQFAWDSHSQKFKKVREYTWHKDS